MWEMMVVDEMKAEIDNESENDDENPGSTLARGRAY